MIVVNSVCGCAAGKARPGIAMALQHAQRPDLAAPCLPAAMSRPPTRARESLHAVSALVTVDGLLQDGKLVFMMERRDIENRDAASIAARLTAAFDEHC